MRKLTIEAIDPETARALYAAMGAFNAELLVDAAGNHSVAITVSGGDGEGAEIISSVRCFFAKRRGPQSD
jgi:hypothetical protein